MNILQAWGQSLIIFKPKNFVRFLLVTLNNIVQTYYFLVRYCWWVLLPILFLLFWKSSYAYPFLHTVYLLLFLLFIFTIYLGARPSVYRKDYLYIWQSIKRMQNLLYLLLIATVLQFLFLPFFMLIFNFFTFPFQIFPLFPFFILFILDSDGTMMQIVQSAWRALKMILYTLPGCLIMALTIVGIIFLIFIMSMSVWFLFFVLRTGLEHWVFKIVGSPHFYLLWLPIPICFYTNFYVKMMYDQFEFYY